MNLQALKTSLLGAGGPGSGRHKEGYGGTATPKEGDRVRVVGPVNGRGKSGTVVNSDSQGSFHVIRGDNGEHHGSFHSSDLKVIRSAANTNQFTKGNPIATKKAGQAAEAATHTVNLTPSLAGHRTAAYAHSTAADHHAAAGNPNQEAYHRKMAEHHASAAAGNAGKDKKRDKKVGKTLHALRDDVRALSNPEGINQYSPGHVDAAIKAHLEAHNAHVDAENAHGNARMSGKAGQLSKAVRLTKDAHEATRAAIRAERVMTGGGKGSFFSGKSKSAYAQSYNATLDPRTPNQDARHANTAYSHLEAAREIKRVTKLKTAGAFPENAQRAIEHGPFKVGTSVMINAPGHECHGQVGSITKCMPEAYDVSVGGAHAGSFGPAQLRVTGSLRMASNPEGINQYTKAAAAHEDAAAAHDAASKLNDSANSYNERVKAYDASKAANGATGRATTDVSVGGRSDAAIAHSDRATTRSREAKESNSKIYAAGRAHREAANAHRDIAGKLRKMGAPKTLSQLRELIGNGNNQYTKGGGGGSGAATSKEKQGNGVRHWFKTPEDARAFAKEKKAAGHAVIHEEDGWNDPDEGPSIWVGPKGKASSETKDYLSGIDPASGYHRRGLGGPGSGWTRAGGHVPGATANEKSRFDTIRALPDSEVHTKADVTRVQTASGHTHYQGPGGQASVSNTARGPMLFKEDPASWRSRKITGTGDLHQMAYDHASGKKVLGHKFRGASLAFLRELSNPLGINQYTRGNAHLASADANKKAADAHRRASTGGSTSEAAAATAAAKTATDRSYADRASSTLARVFSEAAVDAANKGEPTKEYHEKAAFYHDKQAEHNLDHARSGTFIPGVGTKPPPKGWLAKRGLSMNINTLRDLIGNGNNQYTHGHGGGGSDSHSSMPSWKRQSERGPSFQKFPVGGKMPFESAAQRRSSTPTAKDTKRISDIMVKSGGVLSKAHDLAYQMASAITDPMKASRRGRAADSLGHTSIATIFHDRHRRLIGRAATRGSIREYMRELAAMKTLASFEEGDAVTIVENGRSGFIASTDDGEYDVEDAEGDEIGTFLASELRAAGKGAIHTEKWHRCWEKVQDQGHDESSAAAICTSSIGADESLNK